MCWLFEFELAGWRSVGWFSQAGVTESSCPGHFYFTLRRHDQVLA
jgi:hypothetical protein